MKIELDNFSINGLLFLVLLHQSFATTTLLLNCVIWHLIFGSGRDLKFGSCSEKSMWSENKEACPQPLILWQIQWCTSQIYFTNAATTSLRIQQSRKIHFYSDFRLGFTCKANTLIPYVWMHLCSKIHVRVLIRSVTGDHTQRSLFMPQYVL